MNSLNVLLNELNTDGISVEVKRHRPDGILESTKPSDLANLGTKAKLAETAKLLSNLTGAEKLQWAMEMKSHGNEFFAQQNYQQAMMTYVEALTAANFGVHTDSESHDLACQSNVDVLVVPILCNLSVCCMQSQEYNKAVLFSQQAIDLRPHCVKAHFRKGTALLRLRDYSDALLAFKQCQPLTDCSISATPASGVEQELVGAMGAQRAQEELKLSENDRRKLPLLIAEAKRGAQAERAETQRHKAALMKAFNTCGEQSTKLAQGSDLPGAVSESAAAQPLQPMTLWELLAFFLESIVLWLSAFWSSGEGTVKKQQ